MKSANRCILTGGGTGGHVYPCLAIYEILKEQGIVDEALFLGVRNRAEATIVPRFSIPIRYIKSAPFASGSPVQRLRALSTIARGTLTAIGEILRFRPKLIIATGGYTSAPVLFAASLLKPFLSLSIVVEEQNLVPGMLNKVASVPADVVLVNFKKTAYFTWGKNVMYVGYPVRAAYRNGALPLQQARKKLSLPSEKNIVLITGGSLGSRSINQAVVSLLPQMRERSDVMFIHSLGLNDSATYHAVNDTVERLATQFQDEFNRKNLTISARDGSPFYQAMPYIHDMFSYQSAADIIVSRAGAGSLAEIAALAKPAVLIPKRGLPGDHQELNALELAEKTGCEVIFEKQQNGIAILDANQLHKSIEKMLEHLKERLQVARNMRKLHVKDVHKRIYTAVKNLLQGKPMNFVDQIVEPQFVKFQRSFDHVVRYLDQIRITGETNNPYFRFYSSKIEEYLASDNYLTVNKGIKLIGALGKAHRYPFIIQGFTSFKGFLRRNGLIALQKAAKYDPQFRELVLQGLDDSYFEVRREAVRLIRTFSANFLKDKEVKNALIAKLSPWESFEVKGQVIITLALLLDQTSYFELVAPFRTSRQVRLREALLDGISLGLKSSRFKDLTAVEAFLKQTLITTSDFNPDFLIRRKYLTVLQQLEQANHG